MATPIKSTSETPVFPQNPGFPCMQIALVAIAAIAFATCGVGVAAGFRWNVLPAVLFVKEIWIPLVVGGAIFGTIFLVLLRSPSQLQQKAPEAPLPTAIEPPSPPLSPSPVPQGNRSPDNCVYFVLDPELL